VDKPVESLCALCADLAFPCTRFCAAYPALRLSNAARAAIILVISKSAAISRRDAAKTLTGFASAGRQRGRDGLRTWDASPANANRAARTRREMSLWLSPQGCFKPGPPGAERRWDRSGSLVYWGRWTEQAASAPRPALPGRPVSAPQGRRWDGPEDGPARDRPRPRRDRCQGLFAEAGGANKPRNAKRAGRRRTADSGERPAL